jgi:hypothetical protein
MGAPFDSFITRYGTFVTLYGDDASTVLTQNQPLLFENARTIDMLGRAQADLFHVYVASTFPLPLDTAQIVYVPDTQDYYLLVKPLDISRPSRVFMDPGYMASCLQLPMTATLKELVGTPGTSELNAMDEPTTPSTLQGLRTRTIPIALENDFEPLLLSGTQMTTLPEGIMTVYVPRGISVDTDDVLVLDDGTALRIQQANRYPAQGKIFARQIIGQVLATDPYA